MKERQEVGRFHKLRLREGLKKTVGPALAGITLLGAGCGIAPKQEPELVSPIPIKVGAAGHSPDWIDTGSPRALREEYQKLKEVGFQEIRFDWRWRDLEPSPGQINRDYESRLKGAVEILNSKGLKPTVVLSTFPDWEKKLYKTDKEKSFHAWENYVSTVTHALEKIKGPKVEMFQFLNELNHFFYDNVDVEDLPRFLEITKKTLQEYNPDAKIMITLNASNLLNLTEKFGLGHNIMDYMDSLEHVQIGKHIDEVGVDSYNSSWNLPIDNRWKNKLNIAKDVASGIFLTNPFNPAAIPLLRLEEEDFLRSMFADTELLKKVFQRLSSWGVKYRLAEMGFPTNALWARNPEKMQEDYYKAFLPALTGIFDEFKTEGRQLPEEFWIRFYQAEDERPRKIKDWILALTPDPQSNWGLWDSHGNPKLVVKDGTLSKQIKLLNGEKPESRKQKTFQPQTVYQNPRVAIFRARR